MFSGDTFGMELNAVDWQRRVAKAHDMAVIAGRIHDKARRHIFDDKRMIARCLKRRWQAFKQSAPIMCDGRCFAVHQSAASNGAAKMLADGLVA